MTATLIEPLEARIAPATFIVTNNLDAGSGSLRQAILDANARLGDDSIEFGISSSSIIRPLTPLPTISDSVYIRGYIGNYMAMIDGSSIDGGGGSGIVLQGAGSSGSYISGLSIYGFDDAGIAIVNSSGNKVIGNNLGINNSRIIVEEMMTDGILVDGGEGNEISSNVIGGNESGIHITGGANRTKIAWNHVGVGTTAQGDAVTAIPNNTGILVEDADSTVIDSYNRIVANEEFGIKLTSKATGTEIYLNYIGVMPQSFPKIGSQKWGLYIDGASDTKIGSGELSSSFNRGNVIGNNTAGGIWINCSTFTSAQIVGNVIGGELKLNGAGTGNAGPGILITANVNSSFAIASNVIADNTGAGIEIRATQDGINTEIRRNLIGTDRNETKRLGNSAGIIVEGASGVTVGGPNGLGNTIVANKGNGILIKDSSSVGVLGNNIGYSSRSDGAPEFGNAGHGVHLVNVTAVNIGYSGSQAVGNVITFNGGDGIRLEGDAPPDSRSGDQIVRIAGNFVGTDGLTAKGNQGAGIYVLDLSPKAVVTIGGNGPMPNLSHTSGGNVVSGNHGDGILVERVDNVSIVGNYVGTDFRGVSPLGNGGDGIALIDTNLARITAEASPSVVSANLGHGISIIATSLDSWGYATSKFNFVQNTNVGLGADGNTRMANGLSAVAVDNAVSSSIGRKGTGNRIFSQHVALELHGASDTSVFDNEFRSINGPGIVLDHGTWGTEFGGTSNDGSFWKAGNVVISEANAALLISGASYNSFTYNRFEAPVAGISILTGVDNTIYGNRFAIATGGLFIDLGGDGMTPNDPLDMDSGPNDLLNSPALVSAAVRDGRTLIRGEYRGAVDVDITVSWYANGTYVGTSIVHTDVKGMAKLEFDLEEEFAVRTEFRACVSDYSDTSEFSNAVLAMEAPDVIAKGAAAGQRARAQLVDAVTGNVILEQLPFGKVYRGGVSVATADVDGDGFTDLIATQRKGDGVAKIYSGLDGHLINSFWLGAAKGSAIRSLAVGDLDGDGSMEIVTALAHTRGGQVLVHDALTGVFEADFAPFGVKIPSRLSVGLSDADGDGHPEIIVLSGSKRVVLDPMSGQIEQLARLVRG